MKSPYREWYQRRFKDCDAVENQDFQGVEISTPSGQHKIDHIILLDTAKEMAMLERNERGKQVRRYFIEVEKRYKNAQEKPMTQAELVLWSAQQLVEQERRMAALEEKTVGLEDHGKEVDKRLDELDARTTTRPQVYYTIAGY